MRVIIAGSRNFNNFNFLKRVIKKSGFQITKIISGGARGVDRLGEKYSKEILKKDPEIFKANWKLFGKRAGMLRNEKMAKNADALIAICINESSGTKHMINIAKNMGLKYFLVKIKYETERG